jgi:hypothetical protein
MEEPKTLPADDNTPENKNERGHVQKEKRRDMRRFQILGVIGAYIFLTLLSLLLLERQGNEYLDRALLKATASYGVARGLNGVVTVVKESSVSAGMVVGGTIAVGQILDPVNDLIERFSWVMVLSIISLGTQKLLMAIGAKVGIILFVAAIPFILIGLKRRSLRRLGYKLLLLAIVVQVALPVITTVGALISAGYLQERYQQAEAAIADTQQAMQEEYAVDEESEDSKWYEKYNPRKIILKVKNQAANLTEHIVELIVIFSFETVVLPLITLWGLLQVLNAVTGRR